MTTKLTLTVDTSVIQDAKRYAHESGRSLSKMVENYLRSIVEERGNSGISPRLKRIHGAVNLPHEFDEKVALRNSLQGKHL